MILKHILLIAIFSICSLTNSMGPTAAITSPANGSTTSDQQPTIIGTLTPSTPNYLVSLFLNSTLLADVFTDANGVFTLPSSGYGTNQLQLGLNSITASPVPGNDNTVIVTLTDIVSQAPIITTPPTNTTFTTDSAVSKSFDVGGTYDLPASLNPENHSVVVLIEAVQTETGQSFLFTDNQAIRTAGSNFNWSAILNDLPLGNYSISATAFVSELNGQFIFASPKSAPVSIDIIRLSILVSVTTSGTGVTILNINGTAQPDTTVTVSSELNCTLSGSIFANLFDISGILGCRNLPSKNMKKRKMATRAHCTGILGTTTADANGAWSISFPFDCSPGAYSLTIDFIDPSGTPRSTIFLVIVPGENARISLLVPALFTKFCNIIVA